MKASEIKVGEVYSARISGKVVRVRVDAIREGVVGYRGLGKVKTGTRYDVTNLVTGRKVVFKSAAKFRARALGSGRVAVSRTNDPVAKRVAEEVIAARATSAEVLCPTCRGSTYAPGRSDGTYNGPEDDCQTCGGTGAVHRQAEAADA